MTRTWMTTTDHGYVCLMVPVYLTAADVSDLREWFALVQRAIERAASDSELLAAPPAVEGTRQQEEGESRVDGSTHVPSTGSTAKIATGDAPTLHEIAEGLRQKAEAEDAR